MKKLILYSNTSFYSSVLNYIYNKYDHKINDFEYLSENIIKSYEYRNLRNETRVKMCSPCDTTFSFIYENKENECCEIRFQLETILQSNQNFQKIIQPIGCSTVEEIILKKIILQGETKEILINFVDKAKKFTEDQIKLNKK